MWEKLFSAIKDFLLQAELTRRHADDIREIRRRNEEITIMVEKLAFEIQRVRENEFHEREKHLMRLELGAKTPQKQLPKKRKIE